MIDTRTENVDFPVVWAESSHAELQWTLDDMHCPHPLPPLAGDYMTGILADGFTCAFQRTGQPVEFIGRVINGYAYFTTRLGRPESERAQIINEVDKVGRELSLRTRDYWDNEALPILRETYDWMRAAPLETASPSEIADLWDEARKRTTRLWDIHFMAVSACYTCLDDLVDLYESLFEGAVPSEALSLAQGQPGDLHRVESDLYNLAEQVRRSPALAKLLGEKSDLLLSDFELIEDGPAFLRSMGDFLREHGHLGQPFDDLSYPAWGDRPELLLAELRKRLNVQREDPEQLRLRLVNQADKLAASTRERLRDRPEDLARFDKALVLARTGGPLTEDHNYWLDRMLHAHFHRFVVRIGKRLVEAGALEEAHDIFFLHYEEVGDALRKGNMPDLKTLVSSRKSELEKQRDLRPPKIVGKPRPQAAGTNRFSPTPTETSEAGVLKGIGACAGTVTATARIALSPADFEKVQVGDILVCPASNPSWVPLFGIIAGLVTNTGGVLAHAAVTAREFGVPAVVGVSKATEVIRDGQTLEIDGAAGIVRLL